MHHLASIALEHEVGRMAIAKTEDMADHAVDCKRASVGCATLKPVFRVNALEPEDPVEVLTKPGVNLNVKSMKPLLMAWLTSSSCAPYLNERILQHILSATPWYQERS